MRELVGKLINASPDSIALDAQHRARPVAAGAGPRLEARGQRRRGRVGVPGQRLPVDGAEPPTASSSGRPSWSAAASRRTRCSRWSTTRTRVVALSHVEFWNGFRVDIETIGAECRRRGIVFAVDVMQSVGALRVDVDRMSDRLLRRRRGQVADRAAGSRLLPTSLQRCWNGCGRDRGRRARSRATSATSTTTSRSRPTARRFEESVVSLLDTAAFGAALDLLLEVGADVIEERVLDLVGTPGGRPGGSWL